MKEEEIHVPKDSPPPPIRITLASLDEFNALLQNGLDFYGATFFPTESNLPQLTAAKIATKRGRYVSIYICIEHDIALNKIKLIHNRH